MINDHIKSLRHLQGREGDVSRLLHPLVQVHPFLRALLVADGTVTLLLRAYFGEQVNVQLSDQNHFMLEQELPVLGLKAGDDAFYRAVQLVGADSGNHFADAVSVLNPASLDPSLFTALTRDDVGMGDVLRNSTRGSYREVLGIRREDEGRISRTYTVVLDGHPAIMITETFNEAAFT